MMPVLLALKYWLIMRRIKFYIVVLMLLCSSAAFAETMPSFSLAGDDETKPAKKQSSIVELEADKVGFSQVDNKATADGHVVVKNGEETLYADSFELDRTKQEGIARGHVYMDSPRAQVDADEIKYNFNQQTGIFTNARVFNAPYQIKGPHIEKLSATHYGMNNGYMSTCDHDIPHFRLQARRMDVYQGDKAIARRVKMFLGKMPVMYMPRYTQDLKNKPWLILRPGKTKEFGLFLLASVRQKINEKAQVTFHVDYRELKDLGVGADYRYRTTNYGDGVLKTYYTNERNITAKHLYQLRSSPTIERERYKAEWRHKWDINDKTNVIWQYYRLSDDTFLKEYFEREHRQGDASTYFFLTRSLPHGNVSFRVDKRVNRFVSAVDREPEIKYENNGQEIADTGIYVKTTDTFSNLVNRAASPTEDRRKTMRIDSNNELYYPMKIAFVEARPFVGGQHTYYSRAIDPLRNNTLRGVFRSGSDLSTKFYRVWNYKKDILGVKIDRLRHVVTPTIAYLYQHRPTIASSFYNQFDGIDAVDRAHKFGLGLENKFQTKRDGKTVDLLRALVSSDFALKENPGRGGFGPVNSDFEFKPNDWLTMNADMSYDHYNDRIASASFETYINNGDKWTFGLGRRYSYDADDEVTSELNYKINSKWRFKIYERFAINTGVLKEENYALTRDLHEWEMDINYRSVRGGGSDIMMIFRLKAFPDTDLDLFNTGFNKRKTGSQSSGF